MKMPKIKPIPKCILKLIIQEEKKYREYIPSKRFYAYLTQNDGELVKIIVACKNDIDSPRWRCKQVVIHGIHSKICFLKDIYQNYMRHYCVGWYEQGLQKQPRWYEDKDWDWSYDKYFNIQCSILNPEYALKFPAYKYSAVDKYPYCDTLKYLRIYEQYPQAEMLVKFGLYAYATSKQILRLIGTDKSFRKWIIRNKDEILKNGYYVQTIIKAYKSKKSLKQIQYEEKIKKEISMAYIYRNLKGIFKGNDLFKFATYIKDNDINLSSYIDYYNACTYINLDMTIPKNKFPKDFKRWHDIRIDEYHTAKALKDAKERKEMCAQFASIAKKYLPLQIDNEDKFIVIIARSPQDLIREGEILHHCVGRMNYDQRFIREESLIFFVRDNDTPETSFVTLEYSLKNHKVLQCYGEHDTRPNEQVLNFVNNKWLPYANRQIKKIEKLTKQVA